MISIIIVHYKVKEVLFACLRSIKKSRTRIPYEIIVVDNDERKTIGSDLKKQFPSVTYIKSPGNIGYGAGNNLGAKHAKGNFLFFLNPDTEVRSGAIDALASFLKENKDAGIVAPLLLDQKNEPYLLQGARELGFWQGVFALSFINKLFPNNPVSKNYWMPGWNKAKRKEVDVVPGTAFVIRKKIFEQIAGFDERFFLFFEEMDLCKRVRHLGYTLFIIPEAKVMHIWGESTKKSADIQKIFNTSRFYYFKKWFGVIPAVLIHLVTSLNKYHFLLGIASLTGLVLRLYRVEELMPFIGDQGWYFLSARDMIISGNIPFVGIPSSRPWLHQGALWTYLLAPALWFFQFNPVAGTYLSITFGIGTIILLFIVGSKMFSHRTGIIAAFLYAASPLAILHDQTPYHISPIPLFTLLYLFALYKWMKGKIFYFPLAVFTLAVLFNLEIATIVLSPILFLIALFGYRRKEKWVTDLLNKNLIIISGVAVVFPMLPMIIYDVSHGFPQTGKFSLWIPYRIAAYFGYKQEHTASLSKSVSMIRFFTVFYQRLIFISHGFIAAVLFFSSMGWLLANSLKQIRHNAIKMPYVLLLMALGIPFIAFLMNQTPSDAYLPVLFPPLMLVTALFFDRVLTYKKLTILTVIVFLGVIGANIYFLLNHRPVLYGFTLNDRYKVAKEIIALADNKAYTIIGRGSGSKFESFTMNYEYLTWWLGNGPVKNNHVQEIAVEESSGKITVTKL